MRNDILGGATTFVAMAYIIVVNPAVPHHIYYIFGLPH